MDLPSLNHTRSLGKPLPLTPFGHLRLGSNLQSQTHQLRHKNPWRAKCPPRVLGWPAKVAENTESTMMEMTMMMS